MSKIPYALTLLVAYVIVTFQSLTGAISGEAASLASTILYLGPLVLAVLLAVNMKKNVCQIAAIVCLVLSAVSIYSCCIRFAGVMELLRANPDGDGLELLFALPSLLHLGIGGLLYWFVGAHIQDGEITGTYKVLAGLSWLAQIFFTAAPLSSGYGGTIISLIPNLLMIHILWNLPHAFVNYDTAKKTRVKNLVSLVILIALSFYSKIAYMAMIQGY